MENNYISVSQVNSFIKNIFDAEYLLQNIFIYGEVGNFNISNGIAYFNLKDGDNLLPCVLFNARMFKAPNIGDMVLLKGSVSYYSKGGKLSFNAVSIQEFGKGLLYEKFLELKNKLEQKGYFDSDRKKTLPEFVKTIGVVSSETGAVIQDIINVTRRRNDSVNIILYPVKVQGIGAEYEIAKGIEFFNSGKVDVDCVIVARGGGSLEDLQPFNTEIVADAIFNSKLPVVSAVGHETDYTICDFVSDLRAPTPSAGAELVVFDKSSTVDYIANKFEIISKSFAKLLDYYINKLNSLIFKHEMQLNKMEFYNSKIISLFNRMYSKFVDYINEVNTKLTKLDAKVDVLNPVKYSQMGLFQIFKDDKLVKDLKVLCFNDNIKIMDHSSTISATIDSNKEEE